MRTVSVLFAFVATFVFVGCDAIYERPEPDSSIDFGEPYTIGNASQALESARAVPYVSSDDHLVVDVQYRTGCESSRFILRAQVRDQETIDFWLVHNAAAGSCGSGNDVTRRLVFDLPASVERFRRQILLTPDRGSIVLERELG